MTHSELVQHAAKWLRSRDYVVFTEFSTEVGEIPDAIGFKGERSCVIECKATVLDFKSDARKYFRQNPISGMGQRRYLLSRLDVPAWWGLLEVGADVRVTKVSRGVVEWNSLAERSFLTSMLRRAEIRVEAGNLAPSLDRWLKYDNRPPRKRR